MTGSAKDLIPSEEEIRQLLDQTIRQNPSRYPAVVLRIELARLIVKFLDKFEEEFNESIRRLQDSLDNK